MNYVTFDKGSTEIVFANVGITVINFDVPNFLVNDIISQRSKNVLD